MQAGDYEISHPGLTVYDSGIVIRGQGQGETGGTKLIYTSTISDSYAVTLGFTNGGLENVEPGAITYSVTDSYVPVGSKTLSITDASSFSPGDRIVLKLQPNDDWLLHSKYGDVYLCLVCRLVLHSCHFFSLLYVFSVKHGSGMSSPSCIT